MIGRHENLPSVLYRAGGIFSIRFYIKRIDQGVSVQPPIHHHPVNPVSADTSISFCSISLIRVILSSTPKDTRRELIAGLQFPMIEYTFTGPGFATLEARHSLRAFLGKEVFKSYAPYMRPTLTYRIDGAKIKPLKP